MWNKMSGWYIAAIGVAFIAGGLYLASPSTSDDAAPEQAKQSAAVSRVAEPMRAPSAQPTPPRIAPAPANTTSSPAIAGGDPAAAGLKAE
jgi:hypothetical protein